MRQLRHLALTSSLLIFVTSGTAPATLAATSCTTPEDCDCNETCTYGTCVYNAECDNDEDCEVGMGPGSTCNKSACHQWECTTCSCQDYGFANCSQGTDFGLYGSGDYDYCTATLGSGWYWVWGMCEEQCADGSCPYFWSAFCEYAADHDETCDPTVHVPCRNWAQECSWYQQEMRYKCMY